MLDQVPRKPGVDAVLVVGTTYYLLPTTDD